MTYHHFKILSQHFLFTTKAAMLNISLYSLGPFFGYPWKFYFNLIHGSDYDAAFEKFSNDHQGSQNLLLHVVAMVFQLFMNFHLLNDIDEYFISLLPGKTQTKSKNLKTTLHHLASLSFLTMVGWLSVIWGGACEKAPLEVKIISSLSLSLAYLTRTSLSREWDSMIFVLGGLCDSIIYPILVLHRPFNVVETLICFVLRSAVLFPLVFKFKHSLEEIKGMVMVLSLLTLVGASCLENVYDPPVIFLFGLLAWIPALLTNNRTLYFLSCGFLATLCQGVIHEIVGEAPTMPGLKNIGHEYAHVTYFPVMLWNAIFNKMR